MCVDIEAKKGFLQQGAALYHDMICLSSNDVVRRYLAFRIIVNAMSFEDIVGSRQNARMREIRNVLLAHKQEDEFFKGHRAVDEITMNTINPLLDYMTGAIGSSLTGVTLPELSGGVQSEKFKKIVPLILSIYERDFLSGYRMINNFLCFTGNSVQEITAGGLPGVFYRYHSSKALYDLSEYIFNNARSESDLVWLARHAKLDMLLHAQNMADCAIKDASNHHSIDGLLEVMLAEQIGDPSSLTALKQAPLYAAIYQRVRAVRNALIGHMDKTKPLNDLISNLDALADTDPPDLVNTVDKAACTAAQSHTAIWGRYITGNQVVNDPTIRGIVGVQTKPY